MKPNDKAYREFMRVYNKTHVSLEAQIMASLTAAYAAQFQSEDYADVIKSLSVMHGSIISDAKEQFRDGIKETMPSKAADALEAVLAERDALNSEIKTICERESNAVDVGFELKAQNDQLRAERDALAARLAPVEGEKLVEIVAEAINDSSKNIARAALEGVTEKSELKVDYDVIQSLLELKSLKVDFYTKYVAGKAIEEISRLRAAVDGATTLESPR